MQKLPIKEGLHYKGTRPDSYCRKSRYVYDPKVNADTGIAEVRSESTAKILAKLARSGAPICKNPGCYNVRKFGSSRCERCSEKYNAKNS